MQPNLKPWAWVGYECNDLVELEGGKSHAVDADDHRGLGGGERASTFALVRGPEERSDYRSVRINIVFTSHLVYPEPIDHRHLRISDTPAFRYVSGYSHGFSLVTHVQSDSHLHTFPHKSPTL